MKKHIAPIILTAILALCAVATAQAQTWHQVNQATVAWDTVTKRIDGPSLPAGDVIKYQIWSKLGASGTPAKVGAEITATQLTVSFPAEGRYFVGVSAIRYPVGETTGIVSDVSWSSDPLVCQGGDAFGIVYYLQSAAPVGLRRVE